MFQVGEEIIDDYVRTGQNEMLPYGYDGMRFDSIHFLIEGFFKESIKFWPITGPLTRQIA